MTQTVAPGKIIRAPFLYQSRRPMVVTPIDDFLLSGPREGLEDRSRLIPDLVDARPDAVLTFGGALSRYPFEFAQVSRILNLSASTIRAEHTRKVPIHSVQDALRLHASAVAFHINAGSRHASEMIHHASVLISAAQPYELPVFGIIYPRGEALDGSDENFMRMKSEDPDAFADLVAHCVSLGVDLGFDAIKTVYTDSPRTFARVVSASDGVPVLIAGGTFLEESAALSRARQAIAAGAAGISFGRNVFGRSNIQAFISEVRTIVREATSDDQ